MANLLTQIVGIVAGVITASAMLPQLIKTIKDKNVDSLSIGMIISLITGLGLWTYYGVLIKDIPVIVTNSFSILVNMVLLILKIKYQKK